MIALGPFVDTMRVVAQQREVPLFDRFGIMRHWSETGAFDLYAAGKDNVLAQRVHDCIGRAHRGADHRCGSSQGGRNQGPPIREQALEQGRKIKIMHRDFFARRSSVLLAAAVTLLACSIRRVAETAAEAAPPACSGGRPASAKFDIPLHARRAQPRGRQADQDRRDRLVVDLRRRRELAGELLSEPARGRAAPRLPDHDITVLNRGVNGEEAADMLARFEQDVIAEKPISCSGRSAPIRCCADNAVAAARHAAARRLRAAEGDRRRHRADRSAIRAAR